MKLIKKFISLVLIISLSATPILGDDKNDEASAGQEYRGEGMCVAVIDTGFELEHESFVITNENPKHTESTIEDAIPTLSIKDAEITSCYVSDKIPFAFNYADMNNDVSGASFNGTAMLSIVGGNADLLEDQLITKYGIAPEAQLFAMKVSSRDGVKINEEALIAAIGDSVKLGADVILLPLGDPCGFSTSNEAVHEAIKSAYEAGVIIVAGAGNNDTYGKGSVYHNEYSLYRTTADFPDIGTIADYGAFPEVLTVASSDDNRLVAYNIVLPDGTKIGYSDSNYLYETTTEYRTFAAFGKDKSFEYVITEGLGSTEELLKADDLKGKFAVIQRGTLSFNEKAKNAAALGAIGVIITDNQSDPIETLQTLMDISESPIPVILVSEDAGELLRAEADKRFTVGDMGLVKYREEQYMSYFSACGTTPELILKPNITAAGESVVCATTGDEYTSITSTTASAAKVAGMCAIVKQHLLKTASSLSAKELSSRVSALLVSSASPIMALSAPYSPRAQGGGFASEEAAINAGILLTSNGDYQVSAKDGHHRLITFPLTAENLTGEPRECIIDAVVGSDDPRIMKYSDLEPAESINGTPLSERLGKTPEDEIAFNSGFIPFNETTVCYGDFYGQLNKEAENYEPLSFTLAPYAKATFNISILISLDEYNEYSKIYQNGFFVEGFMSLSSKDEVATLPFVGYSGNYYSSTALDAQLYDGEQPIYDGISFYRNISDYNIKSMRVTVGSNPFESTDDLKNKPLVFSATKDKSSAMLYLKLGLLRSITDVTANITDASGELIKEMDFGSVSRTYVDYRTGMRTSAELPIWDGRAPDNPAYVYPDGEYYFTLSYKLAKDKRIRTLSYTLTLDSTSPIIEEIKTGEDGEYSMQVTSFDNNGVIETLVYDTENVYASPLEDGSFDIRELKGEYIYIEVYDSAFNSTMKRIKNPNYSGFLDM